MENEFNLTDVLKVPSESHESTQKVTLTFKDKEWDFLISTEGSYDAEKFLELNLLLARFAKGVPSAPLIVDPPRGCGIDKFTVKSKAYLYILDVLAATILKPAFCAEEWAMFGKKMGVEAINELSGLAIELNKIQESPDAKTVDREIKKSPTARKSRPTKRKSSVPV